MTDPGRLELSRDEMRALGYLVVDTLVEHFERMGEISPAGRGERAELESLLREPPPEQGTDPADLVRFLREQVFTRILHVDHPRFFAFVPSPSNFVAVMADALASGFNGFVGSWFSGSGMAQVELVVVDWLRQFCGLPEGAGGLFVSGGSMANLTCLAVARHVRLEDRMAGAVVYFSDQTHSSVERALRVLGWAGEQLTRLPSGEDFRLDLETLRRAVAEDRAAGRRPFCVVANAGTTNTGAVDPLADLARFCRAEDLWLHVDGAYGASAALAPEARAALAGLEEVDSLSLDPHKWLFQPFEIGCALVREERWLVETFRILPEYLRDVHRSEEEVNFCDRGVQLTRNFRALKLWMSLKAFGAAAFREAISRGLRLAEVAERRLRESGCFEVVTPAQLGVVSFRYAPPDLAAEEAEAINQRLVGAMLADGYAVVTSTLLRGRTVLRLCTINPRTTDQEIAETVRRLARLGENLPG
ncbi:MAG: aminotransferase class I/II-fold pyridoxal phosphate-dependent enzyme [Acidobacteria bacterium]|nr:aminotransferase class I/II-fold pyridoxal phosphate-dependent enzyme [Acidobacteriota bacterium]